MKKIIRYLLALFCIGCIIAFNSKEIVKEKKNQPTISFTFDDGSIRDMPNYTLEEWNNMILSTLRKHEVKAVLFPAAKFLPGEKGEYILSTWNDEGHKIGNHTYHHPNFNSDKITLEQFKLELTDNDSVLRSYSNFIPLFRFPYLKEGNTLDKRDGFRRFLTEQQYKIGHVTIDASDWYVCSRLIKALKNDSSTPISDYRDFYVQHIFDRACYYDSLATLLTDRKIKHNLLLHHNLTSALFLEDLIKKFKSEGWNIVDADEAFKDPIYNELPKNLPAGESLIWAIAKESGSYESILRYPAEDSRYEKPLMDSLGL